MTNGRNPWIASAVEEFDSTSTVLVNRCLYLDWNGSCTGFHIISARRLCILGGSTGLSTLRNKRFRIPGVTSESPLNNARTPVAATDGADLA